MHDLRFSYLAVTHPQRPRCFVRRAQRPACAVAADKTCGCIDCRHFTRPTDRYVPPDFSPERYHPHKDPCRRLAKCRLLSAVSESDKRLSLSGIGQPDAACKPISYTSQPMTSHQRHVQAVVLRASSPRARATIAMLRAADDATCQTGVTLLATVLRARFSLSDVSPPLTLSMHVMQAAATSCLPIRQNPRLVSVTALVLAVFCMTPSATRMCSVVALCTVLNGCYDATNETLSASRAYVLPNNRIPLNLSSPCMRS